MPLDPSQIPNTPIRGFRDWTRELLALLFPSVVTGSPIDRRQPAKRQGKTSRVPIKAPPSVFLHIVVRYVSTLMIVIALGYATAATFTLTGTDYVQTFDSVGSGLPASWNVYSGSTNTGLGTPTAFTTATTNWANGTGRFANYASADSGATVANQASDTDRVIGLQQSSSFGDPGNGVGAGIAFNFDASSATFSGSGTALSLKLQMLNVQGRSTPYSIQFGTGPTPTFMTFTNGTYTDPGTFGSTTFNFTGDDLASLSGLSNVWIRIVAGTSTGSGSRDAVGLDDFTLHYAAVVAPPVTGYFWTGDGTSLGGNGIWDQNSTPRWSDSATTIVAHNWNTTTLTANFGGSAPTSSVTVSGEVEAGAGLAFTADGYTFSGGTINLVGATIADNVVSVSAGSAAIASPLKGTAGLTKSGTGKLLLTGDNSALSGGITLSKGTLAVGSSTALGATGANTLSLNGGTFTSSNTTPYTFSNSVSIGGDVILGESSTGNLEFSGPIDFAAGTHELNVGTGVSVKISGTTANGGISKAGAGGLEFSVSNSLTTLGMTAGTAVIDAGTTLTLTVAQLNSLGGALTINGTLKSTATGAWGTPVGTVAVGANATVLQQGPNSPTNFVFAPGKTTWATGSTLILRDYATNFSVANRIYNMNLIFDSSGAAVDILPISGNSPWQVTGDFTIGDNTHFQYGTYTGVSSFTGNITVNGVLGYNGGARAFTVGSTKTLGIGVNGAVNMQASQTLTINGTATINGDVGGGGFVAINGGGSATLTSTGVIDAANGTTVGGSLTGRLTGSGIVTALTVASGGTIDPGDAGTGPGTLHADQSAAFLGGGFYKLELKTDGSGTAGVGWDQLASNGILDLSSLTSANPFTFQLQTLTGANANGPLSSWDPDSNHTWLSIVSSASPIVGTVTSDLFDVDFVTGFGSSVAGSFSVVADANGTDLDLLYLATAAPEPSSALSLACGSAMLAGFRRRRRA